MCVLRSGALILLDLGMFLYNKLNLHNNKAHLIREYFFNNMANVFEINFFSRKLTICHGICGIYYFLIIITLLCPVNFTFFSSMQHYTFIGFKN